MTPLPALAATAALLARFESGDLRGLVLAETGTPAHPERFADEPRRIVAGHLSVVPTFKPVHQDHWSATPGPQVRGAAKVGDYVRSLNHTIAVDEVYQVVGIDGSEYILRHAATGALTTSDLRQAQWHQARPADRIEVAVREPAIAKHAGSWPPEVPAGMAIVWQHGERVGQPCAARWELDELVAGVDGDFAITTR